MLPLSHGIRHTLFMLGLLACWLGFVTAASRLEKIRPQAATAEMQVAMPRFIQVALTGGDRFLAANVAVFRTLTTDTLNQRPERFVVQAIVQEDAAWLNPRHEDNYYLATAHLPWNGQFDAAQRILQAASDTRPFDMLPPFFHAFNLYYFAHDPVKGARWMKIAATHAQDEKERLSLERTAARWTEKGQDRHEVVKLLEAMAKQSRYKSLQKIILLRAERVRQLIALDEASARYQARNHRLPANPEALVESGLLPALPHDPFGQGYVLDAQGTAQLKPPPKK